VSGQCACTPDSCPDGCCDAAGACRIDDDEACGTGGGACDVCDGAGETCGGSGQAGVCGCTPVPVVCTTETCGTTITDNCGQPLLCPDCVVIFAYTGAFQEWTVPAGVTTATFDLSGAQGLFGGRGGRTTAVLNVTPRSTYQLAVGGQGRGIDGGFNGGAGLSDHVEFSGGGGGATDVRVAPFGLTDRVLVAGGGGGGGSGLDGGAGGGENGGDGAGRWPEAGAGGGGGRRLDSGRAAPAAPKVSRIARGAQTATWARAAMAAAPSRKTPTTRAAAGAAAGTMVAAAVAVAAASPP
jgi:hypothetical protein